MTKYDRPSGVRQRIREYTPGGDKRCCWHNPSSGGGAGVPVCAQGKPWRQPCCPTCDEKLVSGKVTAYAPTPAQFMEARRCEMRAKGKRRSVSERQRKARAAMILVFHETMPRREVA